MALSRIVYPGDGVTTQFAIPFSLGYIREADVTCRVGDEVDGGGNPVYRTMTFISPELVDIAGTGPIPGEVAGRVVFTRTVERDDLLVDYEDGAIINEVNMNTAQKQALMLVHEVLDGRFEAFQSDLDLGGFRVTNVGDPLDDGDLITLGYANANSGNAVSAAAAALASENAASAHAANASGSASSAATSASTATTKAAEAVTSANTATTKAAEAVTSANTASTHASTAATQAGIATTKANEADASADAAFGHATFAAGKASEALDSATAADTSADNAATSAAAALVSENNVAGASVPVGMVFFSPKGTVPAGYLALEGASFDQAVYPALYSYLGVATLPDYRDRVLRGAGTLAGAVFTTQEDALQAHNHRTMIEVNAATYTAGTGGVRYQTSGDYTTADSTLGRFNANETRVKAAIGKFVIKAYQAIVDGGTADLIAIEAAQQYMVRFDAQTLTQAQKGQVGANIGMAWERIGPTVALAGISLQAWTGLSAYSALRLSGDVRPSVLGVPAVHVSADNGSNYYSGGSDYQYTAIYKTGGNALATSGPAGGTSIQLGLSNQSPVYGGGFDLTLYRFNKAAISYFLSEMVELDNTSSALDVGSVRGYCNVSLAFNALRILNSGGGAYTSGSLTLEGVRG